jgi:hypothetical protein
VKNGNFNPRPIVMIWHKLSSGMRIFWLAFLAVGILTLLIFALFFQENYDRQRALNILKSEAIVSRFDNDLTRLNFVVRTTVKDQSLARLPVDILFFEHGKLTLENLVTSDDAIIGAFIMDDSDYVLQASPSTLLGIRSKRLVQETKLLMSQEGFVTEKPQIYLFPRDSIEFLLPIKNPSSSWLVFAAPLVMERNNFPLSNQKTGVLWVVVDSVALITAMLENSGLYLSGLEAHGLTLFGDLGSADIEMTSQTPIYYGGDFARLKWLLQHAEKGKWWTVYPWIVLFFAVFLLLIIYWLAKAEEQRMLNTVSEIASAKAIVSDPVLVAVRKALSTLADNKNQMQSIQIQEKCQAIAFETMESNFRQVGKMLQKRLDEPLLKLSLASSILRQYCSDRALLPVMEDIQQALESAQRNSQYLQSSLSGEIFVTSLQPVEVRLEHVLMTFKQHCKQVGIDIVIEIDPLIHSHVLVLAQALMEALQAIVRSRPIMGFGRSCGLSVKLRCSGDSKQWIGFVFFNDLYAHEFSHLELPKLSAPETESSTKLNNTNDLDLRLANAYARSIQGQLSVLTFESIGNVVVADIPFHVIDDDPVISNLRMNFTKLLRDNENGN